MESKNKKKRGPKDTSYVNKSQAHEVKYEPKRKRVPKIFGSGSDEDNDPGQRK
jgi:hypothetical protein